MIAALSLSISARICAALSSFSDALYRSVLTASASVSVFDFESIGNSAANADTASKINPPGPANSPMARDNSPALAPAAAWTALSSACAVA